MPEKHSTRIVDLNAVVAEIAKLICLIGGDKPGPRTVLDPGLGRIQAERRLIDWVLVSLASRALGAMAEGSDLVMTTANKELDATAAQVMNVPPGAYVQVEFTLPGAGIEVPAAVRPIVQRNRGAISTHREGGRNTTVAILFPRMIEVIPAERRSSDRKLTGPLILVVDDHPWARESTRQLLSEAGYLVLEAAGRDEAETVLAACRVDLVIMLGAHKQSPVKDRPNVRTISASDVTGSALLETVRREVGEPWR